MLFLSSKVKGPCLHYSLSDYTTYISWLSPGIGSGYFLNGLSLPGSRVSFGPTASLAGGTRAWCGLRLRAGLIHARQDSSIKY